MIIVKYIEVSLEIMLEIASAHIMLFNSYFTKKEKFY